MMLKRRIGFRILQGVLLLLILIAGVTFVGCGEPLEDEGLDSTNQVQEETIPESGEPPEGEGLDSANQVQEETIPESGEPPEGEGLDPANQIWEEIIPEKGTATTYGIPLSLENTQQFIDWYNSIELSVEEQAIKDEALGSLVAPCCDDFPMSTCCCRCNLAHSVWGLSAYLITERGYGVDEVKAAASQWLHFIRPDYYVASALLAEKVDPEQFGFTMKNSCYVGRCDLPFYSRTSSHHFGGCGGMKELIE